MIKDLLHRIKIGELFGRFVTIFFHLLAVSRNCEAIGQIKLSGDHREVIACIYLASSQEALIGNYSDTREVCN